MQKNLQMQTENGTLSVTIYNYKLQNKLKTIQLHIVLLVL